MHTVVKALRRAAAAPGAARRRPWRLSTPRPQAIHTAGWHHRGDAAEQISRSSQLMCASQLVIARSSLSSLLLLKPRLAPAPRVQV